MKSTKTAVLAAVSAALALALAGCAGSPASVKSQNALAPASASFAVDSFNLGAPIYVAEHNGDFAKQKITATTQTFQSGLDGVNAVIAGQLDFGFALDFATVSTASSKLVILGAVDSPGPGYNQMYFGKGISDPKQLAGKKIGVLTGTAQEYLTDKWIAKHGLTNKVQTVGLPGLFEIVSALKTGAIGAAFLYGDGATQAQADKSLTHFGGDENLVSGQGVYMVTLRSTFEKKPALIKRVLTALDSSTKYMKAHPDEAGAITAAAEQGDAAAVAASIKADDPALGMSKGQIASLTGIQAFLLKAKKIPANTDVKASMELGLIRDVVGSSRVAQK